MRTTPKRPCKPRRAVCTLDEVPIVMTCSDVAVLLQVNPENVAALAKSGAIPAVKIGRSWRFRRDDLVAYLDKLFSCGKQSGEAV